jgi:hypothetical protein
VLDVGGTVLYQQTHAGHARLTDDHVRLASVLTGGKYPCCVRAGSRHRSHWGMDSTSARIA